MPVFAAITIGQRFSTVRKTPQARCCSNSARAPEPAVVGHIDEDLRFHAFFPQGGQLIADDVRQRALVTDVRHEADILDEETGRPVAGRRAAAQRRDVLQPRQLAGKRHVFAEGHEVRLVVEIAVGRLMEPLAVGRDEHGRIENVDGTASEILPLDSPTIIGRPNSTGRRRHELASFRRPASNCNSLVELFRRHVS